MPIQFYSGKDIAALLRVSRMSVWRLIRDGKLVAVNIGSEDHPRYRITETALREYMESLPAAEPKQATA